MARWLKMWARGVLAVEVWRERKMDFMEFWARWRARVAPEGPAPIIRMGMDSMVVGC